MPTRNVSLTAEQDEFVETLVRDGKYQNASEAVRDALRGLQQRWERDALRLERLRAEVKAGIDAIARGEFVTVESGKIGDAIAALAPKRRR